ATLFAATYPERVSQLILFGCFARRAWAPDWPIGETRDEFEARLEDWLRNWGKPFELDTGAPSVADDPAARAWFAAYLRFSASPNAMRKLTTLNYELDIRHILPAVTVPTLVLHRRHDQWVELAHAEYLAEHIPEAELRVLPGADHLQWYGDQDGLIAEVQEFITGERAKTSIERALLTVVMLDIVDSTGELASMGDERWRAVLNSLDEAVDKRVPAHQGKRIKHTGDGYLLAFTGPSRAIECSQAIHRDAVRLGLSLRTGIHTGECERRGDDLSGLAVHAAARCMESAASGQIVASRTLRDLVAGSGHEFSEFGTAALKGLPGEWELFSVTT
ncbi:MAG: adenylate/guanylate cyclase domain-containing protein, partial [Limibacillus sp.]